MPYSSRSSSRRNASNQVNQDANKAYAAWPPRTHLFDLLLIFFFLLFFQFPFLFLVVLSLLRPLVLSSVVVTVLNLSPLLFCMYSQVCRASISPVL